MLSNIFSIVVTQGLDNLPSQPSHFLCQDPVVLMFVIHHLHPYVLAFHPFHLLFHILLCISMWVWCRQIPVTSIFSGHSRSVSLTWLNLSRSTIEWIILNVLPFSGTTTKDSWVSTMSPTQNICDLAMRKLAWIVYILISPPASQTLLPWGLYNVDIVSIP
jgi:hypothetical protein